IAADDLASVEVAGLVLQRASAAPAAAFTPDQAGTAAWQAQGLGDGESLDAAAVNNLLDRLAQLSVAGYLGAEGKPEYGHASPAASITAVRRDGVRVQLDIARHTTGEQYSVRSSARPGYFSIESWVATPLLEAARREALLGSAASSNPP